jgi:hypothetical protein
MTIDENPLLNESASPPCYLRETNSTYSGLTIMSLNGARRNASD